MRARRSAAARNDAHHAVNREGPCRHLLLQRAIVAVMVDVPPPVALGHPEKAAVIRKRGDLPWPILRGKIQRRHKSLRTLVAREQTRGAASRYRRKVQTFSVTRHAQNECFGNRRPPAEN